MRLSTLTCSTERPQDVEADLLVIPSFDDDDLADLPGLDTATCGELRRARVSGQLGTFADVFVAPVMAGSWKARRVALLAGGLRRSASPARVRQLGTAAALAAGRHRVERIGFVARGFTADAPHVQALAEGLTLSEFDPGAYKTSREPHAVCGVAIVISEPSAVMDEAVRRGRLIGSYCNMARQLVNEPANRLGPRALAERASALAREAGLCVGVQDEHAIARLGMQLLLASARGSAEPPQLIVLRYQPPDPRPGPTLGLAGKGVTFDAGGVSAKRPEDLDLMKYDMAGGAAVICAMCALAALKPDLRLVAVVPAMENMAGRNAVRPGDVLRSAQGDTVEVVDPDAEGRLILADALWYLRQLGATHLVDVATLTSGCIAALGDLASGLFGSPDPWVQTVRESADRAGERVWPLPLFEEFASRLTSAVADLTNTARGPAAASTAAMFIKQFAGGLPWAHLDIAGTAWNDEGTPFRVPGPTGVGVRTLVGLALRSADWEWMEPHSSAHTCGEPASAARRTAAITY